MTLSLRTSSERGQGAEPLWKRFCAKRFRQCLELGSYDDPLLVFREPVRISPRLSVTYRLTVFSRTARTGERKQGAEPRGELFPHEGFRPCLKLGQQRR